MTSSSSNNHNHNNKNSNINKDSESKDDAVAKQIDVGGGDVCDATMTSTTAPISVSANDNAVAEGFGVNNGHDTSNEKNYATEKAIVDNERNDHANITSITVSFPETGVEIEDHDKERPKQQQERKRMRSADDSTGNDDNNAANEDYLTITHTDKPVQAKKNHNAVVAADAELTKNGGDNVNTEEIDDPIILKHNSAANRQNGQEQKESIKKPCNNDQTNDTTPTTSSIVAITNNTSTIDTSDGKHKDDKTILQQEERVTDEPPHKKLRIDCSYGHAAPGQEPEAQLQSKPPQSQPMLKTSSSSVGTPVGVAAGSMTPTSAQDIHPFARGAVIEVWHIQKNTTTDIDSTNNSGNNSNGGIAEVDDDEWWSEPDSDDEGEINDSSNNSGEGNDKKAKVSRTTRTVRLCDVIDRIPSENKILVQGQQPNQPVVTWRYYVHYRDFNRRMDEWINQDRIVSPPSIGNAKARQLKREEEKERKRQERLLKQQQLQQQEQSMLLISAAKKLQQQQQQLQQQSLDRSSNITPTSGSAAVGGGVISATSTRRRRSSVMTSIVSDEANSNKNATAVSSSATVANSTSALDLTPTNTSAGNNNNVVGRRRRLGRRKSSALLDDDAATITASNLSGDNNDDANSTNDPLAIITLGSEHDPNSTSATDLNLKNSQASGSTGGGGYAPTTISGDHYKMPATSTSSHTGILNKQILFSTQTVGEHVVGTVQAVELDEHEGLDEASLREHEEVTKIKNVGFIEIGRHQMETWYFSPIPKELLSLSSTAIAISSTTAAGTTATYAMSNSNSNSSTNLTNANLMNVINSNNNNNSSNASNSNYIDVLYVCEFTLRMFSRKIELQRYQKLIPTQQRHPPGNEIYRHNGLSMFEIDGYEEKIYCQNLCYIAKLFLDHKTLYFDVDPFLFYILCEVDNRGYHIVGYFSKEKYSDVGYNLACILSFPAHQRKGYGRFLISFSYELSKKEEKVGSPEKPMSDLGQQAYKPYWASTIVDFLLNQSSNDAKKSMSIMDMSKRTSIMTEDIIFTLNQLGLLKILNGVYFIAAEQTLLQRLAGKYPIKEPKVDPTKIHWTPYVTPETIKRDKFSIHSKKSTIDD